MNDLDPFADVDGDVAGDTASGGVAPPDMSVGGAWPSWVPVVAAGVTSTVLVASLWLRWVNAHVGDRVFEIRGVDLILFRWLHFGVAVTILVIALVDARRSEEPGSHVAGFIAAVWCVVIVVTLTVIESTASLLPVGHLHPTLRRFTVDFVAGPGLWLAAAALCLGGIAVAGRFDDVVVRVGGRLRDLPWVGVAGFWMLALGLATLIGARYQPTASGEVAGTGWHITGPATPYYGPWTLIAVWVLVLVLVLTVVRPTVSVAFVGLIVAVLTAAIAGVAGFLAKALSAVPIEGHMPERFSDLEPQITAGRGAWLVLGASVMAGVGCALLFIAIDAESGEET